MFIIHVPELMGGLLITDVILSSMSGVKPPTWHNEGMWLLYM